MGKRSYELPILIGAIGLVFYMTINLAYDINFFISILIMIGSAFLIDRGYKLIAKNYDKKKAGKIRWTLPSFFTLAILVTIPLTFYNPIISFGVGTLLVIISIILVRFMYKDNKNK